MPICILRPMYIKPSSIVLPEVSFFHAGYECYSVKYARTVKGFSVTICMKYLYKSLNNNHELWD